MAAAGLSDGFVFAPKPAAAPAANIRVSLPPHNKDEFNRGNDTIMFNIPCGKRGQYLNTRMSYLKFDVEMDYHGPDGINDKTLPIVGFDGGAHSLFSSLEVYHGTNLLEQIREYNALYSLLTDMGETSTNNAQSRTISEGRAMDGNGDIITPFACSSSLLDEANSFREGTLNVLSSYPVALLTPDEFKPSVEKSVFSVQTPDQFNANASYFSLSHSATADAADDGNTHIGMVLRGDHKIVKSYCIPLVSGIVGAQMGQYLPVGSLAADLRLELGLANFDQAFVMRGLFSGTDSLKKDNLSPGTLKVVNFHTGAAVGMNSDSSLDWKTITPISIKNVELQLEYVEVSADVQLAIEQTTGGQYIMSYDSFANFQNAVPRSATAFNQLIGAKFSSIKTAFTIFRDAYWQNNPRYKAVTSRVNPFSRKPPVKTPASKTLGTGVGGTRYSPIDNRYQSGDGWQYMVGSTYYPAKRVTSNPESWMECVKAFHAVVAAFQPASINVYNWDVSARVLDKAADSTDTMTICEEEGKFFIAQNMESQSHKSHLAESGVNTLAQSLFLTARFPGGKTVVPSNQWAIIANTTYGLRQNKTPIVFGENATITAEAKAGGANNAAKVSDALTIQANQSYITTNQQLQLDHFIHYDGILIVANGIANTRF
jgi:hypothetical protein